MKSNVFYLTVDWTRRLLIWGKGRLVDENDGNSKWCEQGSLFLPEMQKT